MYTALYNDFFVWLVQNSTTKHLQTIEKSLMQELWLWIDNFCKTAISQQLYKLIAWH